MILRCHKGFASVDVNAKCCSPNIVKRGLNYTGSSLDGNSLFFCGQLSAICHGFIYIFFFFTYRGIFQCEAAFLVCI